LAGKNPSQAVSNFVEPLQKAVSCVSDAVFSISPKGRAAGGPSAVTLANGDPVRIAQDLGMRVAQTYHVVRESRLNPLGSWKVKTAAYAYSIEEWDSETEILMFHWHPNTPGSVEWPHLHIAGEFKKLHVPTGRIALEQVVRLAIDMGATCRREDWNEILVQTQGAHETWRTWS
jgi:hypothetical protein